MISLTPRSTLAALAVALWTGAGVFFATSVARAAFEVLPSRSAAGALVGRLLPVVFVSGLLVGLLAFVMTHFDGLARGRLARLVAAAVITLTCVVAQFAIAPRIAALRAQIGPSLDALPPTDALRRQFGQLHALSVALLGVALVAAMFFLVSVYLGGRSGRETGRGGAPSAGRGRRPLVDAYANATSSQ